jgi:hypothetical protein
LKLSKTVTLRIVKPLDDTWDVVGPRLRELSWIAHRVLNKTIARLALAGEYRDDAPAEWRSRTGNPYEYPMCKVAIDDVNSERVKVRRCAWCGGTGVEPADPVDAKGKPKKRGKKQPERAPGEACSRCENGPNRERTIGEPVEVPTPIVSGWSRFAATRYKTDIQDMLRGKKSLAAFRSPAPIVVTSSGDAFIVGHDGKGYYVGVPLFDTRKLTRFAVAPNGPRGYGQLKELMDPAAKVGDLKLLGPKQGKKGWRVAVSYTVEIAEAKSGGPPLMLTVTPRGIAVVGEQLTKPRVCYGVESIAFQRRKFSARRKSRSRHQRDIGKGARGHGKARALQHYHAVDDAEQRWTRSICQEISSKAAATCVQRGAKWCAIDGSLANLLPPAALRSALDWALAKQGLTCPEEDSSGGDNPIGQTPTGETGS